jgi:2-polyprenyl-6-methoxyphenol hydroxylase-like FAD-dependent oxidoreductase
MKNKKILISGAGIAGLSLAYWLRQYGFVPTVIERAPNIRKGGYKVDIRGTALEVVKRMGLHDKISAAKTDMQGASIVDRDGNLITQMSGDTFGVRVAEDLEIMRGDLCQILWGHVQGIECLFNESISTISQNAEEVRVTFESYPPCSFDIVIGADGLHSNVRKIAFGNDLPFLHELGLYISIFTIPNFLNLDRWEVEYSEPGKLVNLYSSRGDSNARAAFLFSSKPLGLDPDDIEGQKKILHDVYDPIGWEIPRLLTAMKETPDFYFDSVTQVCMNHWANSRICLLGDAGYCPSPVSGQGTSLALVGAYVLAGELAAAYGDHNTAFKNYERCLHRYVLKNQELGKIVAKIMNGDNKKTLAVWLHDQFMRIMPGKWVNFTKNKAVQQVNRAANSIKLKDYTAYLADNG